MNLFYSSIYILGSVCLAMSCQRKLELTDVTINLPYRSHQNLQFDHLGRASLVDAVSVLATNVAKVEAGLVETKGVFNSVTPSLATGATYPVNCYLVVLSGPDPELSANFCSKNQDPTQSLAADVNATKLFFGNYVGMIDAFNYGGTVSFSLLPGQSRTFTLLGFNSTTTCSEAFAAFHNKSNLSKAFKLAASQQVDLLPGVPLTVDLSLPGEVDANEAFSDCYIPNLTALYPEYSQAVISKPGFPYSTFRSFSTTQTTNFFCEAIDFALEARDPITSRRVAGTVLEDEYFIFKKSSVVVGTYDSAQQCAEDTSLTDNLAVGSFKIAKNQVKAQRWFKRREGGTASASYGLFRSDNTPIVTKLFRQTFSDSTVFVDNIIPATLVQNVCYEGFAVLRDYKGYVITNPAPFDIVNTSMPTTFYATLYASSSDCESGTNGNPNLNFPASQNSLSYFLKITGTGTTGFEYEVGVSGTTATNSRPTVEVVSATTVAAGEFSTIAVQGRSGLPNNPSVDLGKVDCFPVFTSLLRSDLTEYVQDSTSTFTMLPLKVRVADGTGPNTVGYALYSNDSCTVPVYPVGSAASAAGTAVLPSGVNSSFYKLYIKPDNLNTFGARRLEFLYNDEGVGSYLFHLTNPNY